MDESYILFIFTHEFVQLEEDLEEVGDFGGGVVGPFREMDEFVFELFLLEGGIGVFTYVENHIFSYFLLL